MGIDTITPTFEILNYDAASNSLEIFTENPDWIGTHSVTLIWTMRMYPTRKASQEFEMTILDPCKETGYAFVDTIA